MAERTTTKTKAAAAKKPAARRTPRKAAQEAAAAAQALEQKMKNSHIGGFAEFIRAWWAWLLVWRLVPPPATRSKN